MGGFELLLFTTDAVLVQEATAAGVAGFVVDWERRGKEDRQAGFDTQIGADDEADLRRVRAATRARVLCRINGVHDGTADEVEAALAAGADELLVPMVRRPEQVEAVLARVAGRAGVGILVETVDALACRHALARLPLARIYVGLNDLAIERSTANLFEAVIDGSVERVREAFPGPFGFAGLTLPEAGRPVPCRLLIAEMARLGAAFTMLRRSFLRDTRGLPLATHVPRILAALEEAGRRPAARVVADRRELERVVKEMGAGSLGRV
jgi:citrate lyase beta subunit